MCDCCWSIPRELSCGTRNKGSGRNLPYYVHRMTPVLIFSSQQSTQLHGTPSTVRPFTRSSMICSPRSFRTVPSAFDGESRKVLRCVCNTSVNPRRSSSRDPRNSLRDPQNTPRNVPQHMNHSTIEKNITWPYLSSTLHVLRRSTV